MVGAGQEWARHGVVKGQIQEWSEMGARKQQRQGQGQEQWNGISEVQLGYAYI